MFAACNSDSEQTVRNDTSTNVVTQNKDSNTIISNDSANTSQDSVQTTANKIIIPGNRIGDAVLNMNADSLGILFGKPDMSDAAMGKAWITWYGKKRDEHNNKTELNIYTAYKDSNMRDRSVQQIRTSSSYFSTDNNIHVYSSLEDIQRAFPNAHKIDQNAEDAKRFVVYDDVQQGVAFQIVSANNSNICTGIFVHLKGKKVRDVYIDAP